MTGNNVSDGLKDRYARPPAAEVVATRDGSFLVATQGSVIYVHSDGATEFFTRVDDVDIDNKAVIISSAPKGEAE